MNSEHPQKAKTVEAIVYVGNKNKDITLAIGNPSKSFEMDIKLGNNNMSKPFSSILAEIPHIKLDEPFSILNEPLYLSNIQIKVPDNSIQITYRQIRVFITSLNKLLLDSIQKIY